ncbi:hypothetical protein ACGF12_29600 [Kitasatospora sp. NPDC048296]|jgi:hypothetical protein|uniref:hypothetical protein n=1 Tax=Kitasatospora sp. NPDC048296 TaxID=3364048 RepID=UPI00371D2D14
MSVSAAFHSDVPDVRHRARRLRAALSTVLERLAASPLDSPVLGALGAPRSTARPAGRAARPAPQRARRARHAS